MKMLPILSLVAPACLEAKTPGTRWSTQLAAACAYQVRCGYIGASEEAACADGSYAGALSFLDGRALWQETAGYSVTGALAAGRLRLDPLREAACLEALSAGCSGEAILACGALFEPAVPAGGGCRDGRECVTRACAVASRDFGPVSGDPGCEGLCVSQLATGAACVGMGLACEAGDVCDAASEVCVRRSAAGEACSPGTLGSVCAEGLVCGSGGVCEAPYGAGEGCTHAVFPSGGCAQGLVCVAGTCRPPGAEGEACEVVGLGGLGGAVGGLGSLLGSEACRKGLYCDAREGVGTCRAHLTEGAECDRIDVCGAALACVGLRLDGLLGGSGQALATGRCGPWADVGGTCDPDATVSGCPRDMLCEPASARCVLREVPGVPLGGTCEAGSEAPPHARCAEGACDAETLRCALVCAPP